MYRQSPSRNQRSKGIRIKHVLQICLLLAVCFWLIYQVKHSHDKKKEFDESDAKGILQRVSSDDIRLGRKDLKPQHGGITSNDEKHDEPEEEDETVVEEVQEHKHEEEDEEENDKVEEKDDENKGSGDDETDEHEQEKSDSEVDGGEENVVDDEKEREAGDENETQETDSEDDHGQIDKENSVEENDRDGNDRSTHEAREEHYKADDASSAVTHDTSTENENEHPGNVSEEQNKENNVEENNKSGDRRDLAVEAGEIAQDNHQSNVTAVETNVDVLDNSDNSSPPNSTVTEGSNGHLPSNTSSEVITQNHDLPAQNVTESEPVLEESGLHTVASDGGNNSTVNVDNNHIISNTTDSAETKDAESHPDEISTSSTNNTESSASEEITQEEGSLGTRNITESTSENNDEIATEKISDGTDEILESTTTENPDEVREETIDTSDTSDSLEEKDVRTDLDTLPEIQTEGSHSEDVAAE